jgi:quinol-cytochrome oxidoreductase complex cytochrome b subunit
VNRRRTLIRVFLAAVVAAAAVLTLVGTEDRVRQASMILGLIALLLASRYAL